MTKINDMEFESMFKEKGPYNLEITEAEYRLILDSLDDSYRKVKASCCSVTDTLAERISTLGSKLEGQIGSKIRYIKINWENDYE